jgi:hypothetical protein
MYGLKPTDIDLLTHLRGAEVTQICLGPHDIQFNFHPQGNVSIQGRCELIDEKGTVVEVWEDSTRPGMFRFPEILMTPITEITIDSPKSFMLLFQNQMSLRVIDNSEQYESFSVGNLYV